MTITAAMVKELRELTGVGPLDCKKALESYNGDLVQAADYLREKGMAKAAKKAERETNTGLIVVKAAENRACVVELNCETDFVARTDLFKDFLHRTAESLLETGCIDAPNETIQEMISRLGENIVMGRTAFYAADQTGLVASYVHSGEVEGFHSADEGRIGVLVELRGADREKLADLAHDLLLHITSAGPRYLSPEDVPAEERAALLDEVAHLDKPEAIKTRIAEGRLNSFYQDVCLLKQPFVKDDSLTIEALLDQRSADIGARVTIARFARIEIGG